jgi:hypothetical protein
MEKLLDFLNHYLEKYTIFSRVFFVNIFTVFLNFSFSMFSLKKLIETIAKKT